MGSEVIFAGGGIVKEGMYDKISGIDHAVRAAGPGDGSRGAGEKGFGVVPEDGVGGNAVAVIEGTAGNEGGIGDNGAINDIAPSELLMAPAYRQNILWSLVAIAEPMLRKLDQIPYVNYTVVIGVACQSFTCFLPIIS